MEEHHDNCRKIGSALRACKIWELYPSHHRSCNKFHSVGSNCNCALGAVTARPTSFFNDKATTCLSKTSRERYFVSASAGSASLDTIGSLPRRSSSWTHSCPTARCLTRPTPALLQIPTAAAQAKVSANTLDPQHFRGVIDVSTVGFSRAQRHSLLGRAPVFEYLRARHCCTSRGAPPKHPAISVSTNTSIFGSGCHGNSCTKRGADHR